MPVISWSNVCEGPYQRPFESPYICSQFVRLSPNLMCGCDSYFGISCMATHVIGVYRRGDLPPTEERYGMSVIQWTLWYHQRVPKKITMRSFPPTPSCRLPLIAFPWSAEGLAAAYTAVRCVCVNPLMDSDLTCWAVVYWYITYVHRWACDKAHVKFFFVLLRQLFLSIRDVMIVLKICRWMLCERMAAAFVFKPQALNDSLTSLVVSVNCSVMLWVQQQMVTPERKNIWLQWKKFSAVLFFVCLILLLC